MIVTTGLKPEVSVHLKQNFATYENKGLTSVFVRVWYVAIRGSHDVALLNPIYLSI